MVNLEYEKAFLSCLIFNNKIETDLTKDDFTDTRHQIIFDCIQDLIDKRVTASIVTIVNNVSVSPGFVSELTNFGTGNFEYYQAQLKGYTKLRQLHNLQLELKAKLKDKSETYETITDMIETKLINISRDKQDITCRKLSDLLVPVLNELEACYNNTDDYIGIASGYKMLDDLLNGFQKQEVIIIGARTSIGKTAFVLNMAYNIAMAGKRIAFFSLEMSAELLVKRVISFSGKISNSKLRSGDLNKRDFATLVEVAGKLKPLELYIDDTPNINLTKLRHRLRRMKRLYNIDIAFIDYMGLVTNDTNKAKWERVSENSSSIKQLARELDIPIVVLSQLKRDVEGKRPKISDLRDSGDVENDADIVILMHRERGGQDTNIAVEKNRNGPTGEVFLYFHNETAEFRNHMN